MLSKLIVAASVGHLISGADLYYDDDGDCPSSTYTFDSVYVRGYQTCLYDDITSRDSTGGIYCYGPQSCYHSDLSADNNIYCYGDQACTNGDLSADHIYCHGYEGCYISTIDTTDMNVDGYKGAALSTITLEDTLTARGDYALSSSTIKSTTFSGDTLTINLKGYRSGYGTTIECNRWTTCNLDCQGNACEDLDFICNYGASCDYNCGYYGNDGSYTTYCPTFYDYTMLLNNGIIKNEDEFKLYLQNNDQLNKNKNKNKNEKEIENMKEKYQKNDKKNDNNGIKTDQLSANANKNIMSDSYSILCDSTQECEGDSMTATNNVKCYGYESCENSIITDTPYTYAEGYLSNKDSNVDDSNYVYCTGYQCCKSSTITNTVYETRCHGYFGCYSANINTTRDIEIDGYYGLYFGDVIVEQVIDVNGPYALYYADLTSPGTGETLSIEMNGYYSGYRGEIICESGDTCDLECNGIACYDLDFICNSGATCSYTCGEYGDDDNGATEYCPTYTSYTLMLENNKIKNEIEYNNYIQNKKQERKQYKQQFINSLIGLSDNEIDAKIEKQIRKIEIIDESHILSDNEQNDNDNNQNKLGRILSHISDEFGVLMVNNQKLMYIGVFVIVVFILGVFGLIKNAHNSKHDGYESIV